MYQLPQKRKLDEGSIPQLAGLQRPAFGLREKREERILLPVSWAGRATILIIWRHFGNFKNNCATKFQLSYNVLINNNTEICLMYFF